MCSLNVPEDRLSNMPGTAEILIVCAICEALVSLHSQLLTEISQDLASDIISPESQEQTSSLLFWGHWVMARVFQFQHVILSLTKLGPEC